MRYPFYRYPAAEVEARSAAFYDQMQRRRSLRQFAPDPVPRTVIENLLLTAGTSPSGANLQPWTFCAVSNPAMKRRIREGAEAEERAFYLERAPDDWLRTLQPLGTFWDKPFLEVAPWLIVVFRQNYGVNPDGSRRKYYYVNESVGIAAGFLLTAIHQAGLVALTHTPSPMNFLRDLLGRPAHETPELLIPVGYPSTDAEVPTIQRKTLAEITTWFE